MEYKSEVVHLPLCRSKNPPEGDLLQGHGMIQHLLEELESHYGTARADMMLAAKSKPIHGKKWLSSCLKTAYAITNLKCFTGVLSALQRCLLEAPCNVSDLLDRSMAIKLLKILEDISLLLLAVLYGDPDACVSDLGNSRMGCSWPKLLRVGVRLFDWLKPNILTLKYNNTSVWSQYYVICEI